MTLALLMCHFDVSNQKQFTYHGIVNLLLDTLSHEHSDKLIVGDFNLDLLKINTREKYSE